jgi:lipopolysaccharide transport system permease protein
MSKPITNDSTASEDVVNAVRNFHLAGMLGWQDVAQRYRRSRVGAFWLTINMGVLIGAMGLVFGAIFKSPMSEFLPFICVGLIFWTYFSQTINEGCTTFISNGETILQLPIPFFTYVMRTWWRNTIIVAHNLVIFPIVLAIFLKYPPWQSLLFIPGFILVSANILWIVTFVAILCTRYRDLSQIIQNIMQVGMYVTPIMWMPDHISSRAGFILLNFNPFSHFIALIRNPLLGTMPSGLNWIVSLVLAVVGWAVTMVLFNRYRGRIAYWL